MLGLGCLQGYGLAGDLWAIKERLGLAAVSAASPVVDIRAAHSALARRARLPKVIHLEQEDIGGGVGRAMARRMLPAC